MVVRAGIDQEETENSDLKKRNSMQAFEILVYHENLVTISCFRAFFNPTSSIF